MKRRKQWRNLPMGLLCVHESIRVFSMAQAVSLTVLHAYVLRT